MSCLETKLERQGWDTLAMWRDSGYVTQRMLNMEAARERVKKKTSGEACIIEFRVVLKPTDLPQICLLN